MNASYTLRRNDKQGFPFKAVPFNEGMGGSVGGKLPKKLSAFGLQVEQACGLVPPIAPQSRDREGGGHLVAFLIRLFSSWVRERSICSALFSSAGSRWYP